MRGKEEQNELAVPAIKASARLLLMGSHTHSSQQYFSLMSQVSLSGSCKPPTLSHSHYGALFHTTFPVQLHLVAVCTPSLPISSFGDDIASLQPHWCILQYFLMPCVAHVMAQIQPMPALVRQCFHERFSSFPVQKGNMMRCSAAAA